MTLEMWIAVAGFFVLLILIFMRVWIGMALIIVGFAGLWILKDLSFAGTILASEPFTQATRYTLTTMPLFTLMGAVIQNSNIGSGLYAWAKSMIGHIKGGLGMATIVACGLFSAICGNSQICAMTIGKISYPEMAKAGYSDGVSTGGIAAGGGLGVMIPPSVGFIVYGLITEQSIGRLFMAGLIPGIVQLVMYALVYVLIGFVRPQSVPASNKEAWSVRLRLLNKILPMALLMILILGGIYGGFFTATEAGAMGAIGAIIITLVTGQLDKKTLYRSLVDGARMTATVMILLIGANVFLRFITVSNFASFATQFIVGLHTNRYVIMAFITLLYLVLGIAFDPMAGILLTVPFLFPIVISLGFSPIWFGVFVVAMLEIGMVTPPIGLTCFILADTCNVPVHKVYYGVLPFIAMTMVFVVLLIAFPQMALVFE